MIVPDFHGFKGQHCETVATGSLLLHEGIQLSEPMLFGLGSGLGFLYWKMKTMNFPFFGGRIKCDALTENICRRLNLDLEIVETSSPRKAWSNLVERIDMGKPVGLKLDCFHLEYFTSKFHFAGHYVAMYGYDDALAYLIDTDQQGRKVETSLESLAMARNEKGPMSSKNLMYTITKNSASADLKKAVIDAIQINAREFLNPPIANLGYRGILKASKALKKWYNETENVKRDFQTTAMLMEKAGTGGSLFRNLYRDFLYEAAQLLDSDLLAEVHHEFVDIAANWKTLSDLFYQVGHTGQISFLDQASDLMVVLSTSEKHTMSRLALFAQ